MTKAKERWEKIHGHPAYEVSSHGRIVLLPGREPVLCHVAHGHYRVALDRETPLVAGCAGKHHYPTGGVAHICVARLVYSTFVGDIPNGANVMTRGGFPSDCWMENLRLISPPHGRFRR